MKKLILQVMALALAVALSGSIACQKSGGGGDDNSGGGGSGSLCG